MGYNSFSESVGGVFPLWPMSSSGRDEDETGGERMKLGDLLTVGVMLGVIGLIAAFLVQSTNG